MIEEGKWEEVLELGGPNSHMFRTLVDGVGWIVVVRSSETTPLFVAMTFVPDPNGMWLKTKESPEEEKIEV